MADYTQTGKVEGKPSLTALAELLQRSHDDLSVMDNSVLATSVGAACMHKNINIWAKYKPISYGKEFPTAAELTKARTDCNYGLINGGSVDWYWQIRTLFFDSKTPDGLNGWGYQRPTGGSSSPYRKADFSGYDHCAKAPIGNFTVDGKTDKDGETEYVDTGYLSFSLHVNNVDPATNVVLGNFTDDKYFGVVVEADDGKAGSSQYMLLCKKAASSAPGAAVQRVSMVELSDTTEGDKPVMVDWFDKNFFRTADKLRFYPVMYELDQSGAERNFYTLPYLNPVVFKYSHAPVIFFDDVVCQRVDGTLDTVTISGYIRTNAEYLLSGSIEFVKASDHSLLPVRGTSFSCVDAGDGRQRIVFAGGAYTYTRNIETSVMLAQVKINVSGFASAYLNITG